MNTPEKTLEKRGLRWALIGPTAAFATTAILLIKSAFIYLPLTVVIAAGIYVSWQWRMRGVIFALSTLAVFTVFYFPYLHVNGFYWSFGIFASIAMSYVITALCGSEWDAVGVDDTNSVNEKIRAQALQIQYLEASLKTTENEWANERLKLQQDYSIAEQQISEKESLVHAHVQAFERVHKELEATKVRQEILEADLCDQRQEVRNAYKQVENAKLEVEALGQAKEQLIHDQAKLTEWQEAIQKRQDTLPDTHAKLVRAQDEIQTLHNQLDKAHSEHQALLQVKEQLNIEHNNKQRLQYELLAKEDHLKMLQSQLQSAEEKSNELATHLNREKDISAQHKQSIESIKNEMQAFQERHSSIETRLNDSIHQLNQDKHALETTINEKLALIETLTQDKVKAHHKLEKNRVERRNDGMYLQLRQQFAEKSHQLDVTRQQLFVAQENLLQLQNTLSEEQTFDRNELLTALESNLAELNAEFVALEDSTQREIDSLHQIIDKLIRKGT